MMRLSLQNAGGAQPGRWNVFQVPRDQPGNFDMNKIR